jgi:hypothetical protein
MALEEIPSLPHVHDAQMRSICLAELPLRDCGRLPEMPALETFDLKTVHRLNGIGRWPGLRNLTVAGLFRDLSPLTGLRALTHLTLKGNLTRDLSPLARLPELRRLVGANTRWLNRSPCSGLSQKKQSMSLIAIVLAPFTSWGGSQMPVEACSIFN